MPLGDRLDPAHSGPAPGLVRIESASARAVHPPSIGRRNSHRDLQAQPAPTLDFQIFTSDSGYRDWPLQSTPEKRAGENITGWTPEQFRSHYHDPSITKWDIFHYIYAVLHHPEYRERYAANLRRELPRIPFATATTLNNCHPERSRAIRESVWLGEVEGPLPSRSSVPEIGVPRSTRDDKRKEGSAKSAFSAVKDVDVFRALAKAGKRLAEIHVHYEDQSEYIYAVLHHPEYRERYAANLRRELPRIPFATATTLNNCHPERSRAIRESVWLGEVEGPLPSRSSVPEIGVPRSARDDKQKEGSAVKDVDVFRALAKAGKRLAGIHVHYEDQPEYKLTRREKAGKKLDYRVTKMRLSKDKTTLIYNDFLTLSEIPKATYDYRLGNRSALEWVVDQYQVSTDKRSGITNDPNREDDPQYILRLIGQVVTVSLETVSIVNALPELRIPNPPES